MNLLLRSTHWEKWAMQEFQNKIRTCQVELTNMLNYTIQIKWLMSLNGAHTNHGLIWIHKSYHDLDLKKIITFIVMYFVAPHEGCSQIVIFHEISNRPKIVKF